MINLSEFHSYVADNQSNICQVTAVQNGKTIINDTWNDYKVDDSVVIKNNDLVISVSDDGCGFKNSDIEKATLPFYKSSKDISTEHLGLGLNICKILSERHDGNIQIDKIKKEEHVLQ